MLTVSFEKETNVTCNDTVSKKNTPKALKAACLKQSSKKKWGTKFQVGEYPQGVATQWRRRL